MGNNQIVPLNFSWENKLFQSLFKSVWRLQSKASHLRQLSFGSRCAIYQNGMERREDGILRVVSDNSWSDEAEGDENF
jgi:hypothetical protein